MALILCTVYCDARKSRRVQHQLALPARARQLLLRAEHSARELQMWCTSMLIWPIMEASSYTHALSLSKVRRKRVCVRRVCMWALQWVNTSCQRVLAKREKQAIGDIYAATVSISENHKAQAMQRTFARSALFLGSKMRCRDVDFTTS